MDKKVFVTHSILKKIINAKQFYDDFTFLCKSTIPFLVDYNDNYMTKALGISDALVNLFKEKANKAETKYFNDEISYSKFQSEFDLETKLYPSRNTVMNWLTIHKLNYNNFIIELGDSLQGKFTKNKCNIFEDIDKCFDILSDYCEQKDYSASLNKQNELNLKFKEIYSIRKSCYDILSLSKDNQEKMLQNIDYLVNENFNLKKDLIDIEEETNKILNDISKIKDIQESKKMDNSLNSRRNLTNLIKNIVEEVDEIKYNIIFKNQDEEISFLQEIVNELQSINNFARNLKNINNLDNEKKEKVFNDLKNIKEILSSIKSCNFEDINYQIDLIKDDLKNINSDINISAFDIVLSELENMHKYLSESSDGFKNLVNSRVDLLKDKFLKLSEVLQKFTLIVQNDSEKIFNNYNNNINLILNDILNFESNFKNLCNNYEKELKIESDKLDNQLNAINNKISLFFESVKKENENKVDLNNSKNKINNIDNIKKNNVFGVNYSDLNENNEIVGGLINDVFNTNQNFVAQGINVQSKLNAKMIDSIKSSEIIDTNDENFSNFQENDFDNKSKPNVFGVEYNGE